MDLEFLNTPHFCKWYLARLHGILERHKVVDYSNLPCESFTDLSRIVKASQRAMQWHERSVKWVQNNPVIYGHYRVKATGGQHALGEIKESTLCQCAGLVPFFPKYIKEYISNEAVKNALQSTQDQALSDVLNEYIGIENQVTKVVSSALQPEQNPVTMDAQD